MECAGTGGRGTAESTQEGRCCRRTLMSRIDETGAATMFVSISPTHSRPIAAGFSSPLIGCSPIAIAVPCKPSPSAQLHRTRSAGPRSVECAAPTTAMRGGAPSRRSARGPSRRRPPAAAAHQQRCAKNFPPSAWPMRPPMPMAAGTLSAAHACGAGGGKAHKPAGSPGASRHIPA